MTKLKIIGITILALIGLVVLIPVLFFVFVYVSENETRQKERLCEQFNPRNVKQISKDQSIVVNPQNPNFTAKIIDSTDYRVIEKNKPPILSFTDYKGCFLTQEVSYSFYNNNQMVKENSIGEAVATVRSTFVEIDIEATNFDEEKMYNFENAFVEQIGAIGVVTQNGIESIQYKGE